MLANLLRSVWSYRAVRLVLAALFVSAGVIKLWDLDSFAKTIAAFGMLPRPLVGLLALVMPVVEVVAGLGLLFDLRGSLAALCGLMLLFMMVLTAGIWQGLDIDCGCYGPEDPEGAMFKGLKLALARDLAMLAAAVYLYWWRGRAGSGPLGPTSWFHIKRMFKRGEVKCAS